MMLTYSGEIEEIPYPDEHLEALKRVGPLLIEATKRDGLPIESGQFDLGRVEEDLKLALFFFHWTAESNDVIANLNMVLADLRELPEKCMVMSGSPRMRYYLLVRTYFYEFYRFREIFHRAMKELLVGGWIGKSWVREFRRTFSDAFQHTMEVRHNLVHGSPIWKGEKHFRLSILGGAIDLGIALKSRKTSEILSMGDVLKDVCEPMADSLRDEGMRMSKTLQVVVDEFAKLTSKP